MSTRIIDSSRVCFEPILTLMVSSNIITSASQYLYTIRHSKNLADILNSVNIQPSLNLCDPAPASGVILHFDPSDFLLELSHNRQPRQLKFREEKFPEEKYYESTTWVEMPDLSLIRKRIIESVFTNFYESQKDCAKAKWGKTNQWDSIWQFAWLVRNAFAHRGKINWKDRSISSVSWKNVFYQYLHDNNREIIFNEIGEGDLIILIDELDNALR